MNKIVSNIDNLSIDEMDIVTNKVRAIIIDKDNNILVTKYADMFMLPGGKIDKGESKSDALIRELKEEIGIEYSSKDIKEFIYYENYLKDYPVVGSGKLRNKLNRTYYYIIKSDKDIDLNKVELTEREKSNNFNVLKVNLLELNDIVSKYKSNNIRFGIFKKELLEVLKEYIKSEKLIDMHTHTFYSDGELSPNDLIKLAIRNNIGVLGITDHDTLEGVKSINKEKFSDIRIINGIELTAKVDKGRMHILGYNIDINNKKLNLKMKELKDNSVNNFILLLAQISKDYNIRFSSDDIKDVINLPGNIGRPHIARLCIKYGYANDVDDAFNRYLIAAYDKVRSYKFSLTYQECIELILNSGGIPVLAHPKSLELSDEELMLLINDMIKFGLKGIECYHSSYTKEEEKFYLEIAKKYNLLISGGSDYHGKNKPDIMIGTGNKNLHIKKLSLTDNFR